MQHCPAYEADSCFPCQETNFDETRQAFYRFNNHWTPPLARLIQSMPTLLDIYFHGEAGIAQLV
jgi:hypothetical protein